ncbi:helix-turn-helix domain-containing protein [Elizabethkingia argentiflava]|uniref:Helix-turn-helix domain-containing protein n=2 Tax=Elizabethkingia argenteiflava TaxID=2681556 RepID=A0A845PXR4_9FLAO|nr:helix-turn-helix domain-containing protein [Elizabethkingia argenteiflava]
MDPVEKILERIKEARKEYGYSHENMAHELGISQAAYTNLEKNESKLTVERLLAIASILKKPPYHFLDGTPQNIYNQQNTDNVIGHQENIYKENKEMLEKLVLSYESRIEELKDEILFLRERLKK